MLVAENDLCKQHGALHFCHPDSYHDRNYRRNQYLARKNKETYCLHENPQVRAMHKKSRSKAACLLCPEQESNLHSSRNTHLKRTRLPIPPSGLGKRCPGQESNLHAGTGTTPSKWRVYQFHHLGPKSAAKIHFF